MQARLMHQSGGFPQGATPGARTEAQGHLSRLSDICCQKVWGGNITITRPWEIAGQLVLFYFVESNPT